MGVLTPPQGALDATFGLGALRTPRPTRLQGRMQLQLRDVLVHGGVPLKAFRAATFVASFRAMLVVFHKPFGVLSQFTPDGSPNRPLAGFGFPRGVYPLGRLDADSEGLLLLSDEPELNERLLHPRRGHTRTYWAQVERIPTPEALDGLARGVAVQGRKTLPCRAWRPDPQPQLPPRDPPIRFRKNVPDCWIALELVEGRNRQVRRMTAAIGHPTLRLVRVQIGGFKLGDLSPGVWRELSPADRAQVFGWTACWGHEP